MSMGTCLTDLVARKVISEARAAELRPIYDELVAQYEPKFGRAAAESMATAKAMENIEADFLDRKRVKLLQAKAQAQVAFNVRQEWRGGKPPSGVSPDALVAHLVPDGKAPFANVEIEAQRIRIDARRKMAESLYRHRANTLGQVRNRTDFEDVLDELDGINTGNLNARELADTWLSAKEELRMQRNAVGGRIGKLEGHGIAHRYDGVAVGLTPFEDFRADFIAELDRAKMIDNRTGEPMSDFALDDLLRQSYDRIVSDGTVGREASGAPRGRSFANRHTEHRVFHFQPGGWRRINAKYGAGDAYAAMMAHIDDWSFEIAAMRILGPDPEATIRWMQDMVRNASLQSPSLIERFGARRGQRVIEKIWEELSGANRIATHPNVALFMAAGRNYQTATKLGSALLSSTSDLATQGLTARFNGLPATQAIQAMLGDFALPENRAFVRRAMLIQDELLGDAAQYGRHTFDDYHGGALTVPTLAAVREGKVGPLDYAWLMLNRGLHAGNELSRRAANGVIRASLLNQWTMRMRNSTVMEFWNAVTHYADTGWDDLGGSVQGKLWRGFLDRYGIDAARWDQLRATPRTEWKGSQWILPDAIGDDDLRGRITRGVLTELRYAVTTGGARQRAGMTVGRPGEFWHEVVRSGSQFLLFPITVVWMHGGRALSLPGVQSKVGYAGAFLIATTLMGALSEQLHQLSRGKDPRPMDTSEQGRAFWGRAMSRGGGLGYYGEIFEHSVAENGRGFEDLANAPVLGSADNWGGLLIREPYKAIAQPKDAKGEVRKPNWAKAAARVARYEMPGGNIWYLRRGYEHVLLEQLDELGGRSPDEAARRLMRRAEKEGTAYWAPPGSGPDDWRAPDWANALGEPAPAAP